MKKLLLILLIIFTGCYRTTVTNPPTTPCEVLLSQRSFLIENYKDPETRLKDIDIMIDKYCNCQDTLYKSK